VFGGFQREALTRMKTHYTLHLILATSLLLAPVAAGAPATPVQRVTPDSVSPQAPTSKPTLTDLSWLAGRWQGTWGARLAQQTWTMPKAGVMLGTFQLAEGDKTLVLELFTLVEDTDGIKLYLRHFTPSLTPWEKPGPTTLTLQSLDAKSIVFVNPVDGEPKQDVITRLDMDTYISRSEVVPEKGDAQVTEITYHRVFEGPPPKRRGSKSKPPRQTG
jgi:Domain of unknown function (DUF6265)